MVSVGNLTVGGTGKTPCVEYVAGFYRRHGKRVTILSRGYGAAGRPTTKPSSSKRICAESRISRGSTESPRREGCRSGSGGCTGPGRRLSAPPTRAQPRLGAGGCDPNVGLRPFVSPRASAGRARRPSPGRRDHPDALRSSELCSNGAGFEKWQTGSLRACRSWRQPIGRPSLSTARGAAPRCRCSPGGRWSGFAASATRKRFDAPWRSWNLPG